MYYNTNIVDENSVALAFMDLVELMQNTFDFVHERVQGNFDYGTTWKGANSYQKDCLQYLYQRKALSLENSEISIETFLEKAVMPVFKIKKAQARNRYLEMKKAGLIGSKQIDVNATRVWLKFSPIMQNNLVKDEKGLKGYTTYNTIFLAQKDIISSLKSFKSLKPCENSKSEVVEERIEE